MTDQPTRNVRFVSEFVDEARAQELLASSTANRRISPPQVSKMATDMLAGRWTYSPQPISVDEHGQMSDGQHRCSAVIRANQLSQVGPIAIEFVIAYGVPQESFETMDQGQTRSVAQVISLFGVTDPNKVAAAARLVLRYERFPNAVWSGAVDVSRTEIIEFIHRNEDQLQLLEQGRPVGINRTAWTALQWLVIRYSNHTDHWPDFSTGVTSGANLDIGDPRLALRNRLMGDKYRASTWEAQERLGVGLKAWNGWVLHREIRLLRFIRSELPMPEVR